MLFFAFWTETLKNTCGVNFLTTLGGLTPLSFLPLRPLRPLMRSNSQSYSRSYSNHWMYRGQNTSKMKSPSISSSLAKVFKGSGSVTSTPQIRSERSLAPDFAPTVAVTHQEYLLEIGSTGGKSRSHQIPPRGVCSRSPSWRSAR